MSCHHLYHHPEEFCGVYRIYIKGTQWTPNYAKYHTKIPISTMLLDSMYRGKVFRCIMEMHIIHNQVWSAYTLSNPSYILHFKAMYITVFSCITCVLIDRSYLIEHINFIAQLVYAQSTPLKSEKREIILELTFVWGKSLESQSPSAIEKDPFQHSQ